MSVLRAVADYFVAPPPDASPAPAPVTPARGDVSVVPPAVGVLCRPRHARPVGCAVALHLARRRRAAGAMVAVWTGTDPAPAAGGTAPAGRGARRLAQALSGRGITAHAAGRLTVAALPGDAPAAAEVAVQALAVGAAVPTVLVVAGPREDALDELLATRDLVLIAGDDLPADLAINALRRRGVAARHCALPPPPAAAVATRGGGLLPAARRGLDTALEGLG